MAFDVNALLHNKAALVGIGVAGVAGLYVLIKRKQTTGSTSSDATTSGSAGTTTGFPDTTGTDLASWLGQYSSSLQSQLDAYQQSLNDVLSGLQTMSGSPIPGTGATSSNGGVLRITHLPPTIIRTGGPSKSPGGPPLRISYG